MPAPQIAFRQISGWCSRTSISVLAIAILGGAAFLFTAACPARAKDPNSTTAQSVVEKVERKIGKQPKYVGSPRYALLVLGSNTESKIWMVMDGTSLYVDTNANGDLTDDGPPVQPNKSDSNYVLDVISTPDGSRHTEFRLRHWNTGENEEQYGLSLLLNGRTLMYAGWFGTFWADSPDNVSPIHFGGPIAPVLMRSKEFVVDSAPRRLSITLLTPGATRGACSYLGYSAVPAQSIPLVDIDWPVAEGAVPLHTTTRLTERCCYWEFYDSKFQVPAGVVPGTAKVKLSLSEGAFPLELTTDRFTVPVRANKSEPAAE